jgi:hypothetical protein
MQWLRLRSKRVVLAGGLSLGLASPLDAACGHLSVRCENGEMHPQYIVHVQYDVRASAENPEVVGYLLYRTDMNPVSWT